MKKGKNRYCNRVAYGYSQPMKNALTEKLEKMTIAEVCDVAAKIASDMRDEAGAILDAALTVLESKMDEADFVRFCEKLA